MAEILIVEDEENARKVLNMGLSLQGHQVTDCSCPNDAETLLGDHAFDVVITDLRMEGRDAGLEVIRMARQLQPHAQVLLLTAYASAETAVAAMKEGAFDYLTKPVSGEELAAAVERALFAGQELPAAAGAVAEVDDGRQMLIGESEPMQRVRERLRRAARSDFTVLISGESGAGKELAARFVHRQSTRGKGPFTPVHCGAIPEGLFESELFGHRKGAFTGAEFDRVGLVESADGGTLFLDEVGEMPLAVQVKLLRVLQEKRIRRVGEDREREVNVRIIAATNRDLESEVQKGHFREDLFFRLNVVPVHMPPLRHRREDIPELARALVAKWSGGSVELDADSLERLGRLPLLGNVRELENLLQRMLALSDGEHLDASLLGDLYAGGQDDSQLSLTAMQKQFENLDDWMSSLERRMIEEALTTTGGNITRAADELGITFRSLRYRLKKLGLSGGDE